MKNSNFISFLTQKKISRLDSIVTTVSITLAIMYAIIVAGLHTMQVYKWYCLSVQKNNYNNQALEFDSVVTTRSALQKSKEELQGKVNFFKKQKKEQHVITRQLHSLYCDGAVFFKSVSINDYRFDISLEIKTVLQAHQFLKKLKEQPLVHKARIVHLSQHDKAYAIQIKGKFKNE